MDFFPCSCFLLEAVTKKKSPSTCCLPFFLTRQLSAAPAWISGVRSGISQDVSRTDFKDCSRETWNCCKPFPWRIAMKIVLSSLLSYILKCNLSKCRMLISSELCNHINLYSTLIQSFLATYPATIIGNWKEKDHKLSRSLILLCKKSQVVQTPRCFEKCEPVPRMGEIWLSVALSHTDLYFSQEGVKPWCCFLSEKNVNNLYL